MTLAWIEVIFRTSDGLSKPEYHLYGDVEDGATLKQDIVDELLYDRRHDEWIRGIHTSRLLFADELPLEFLMKDMVSRKSSIATHLKVIEVCQKAVDAHKTWETPKNA